MQFQEADAEALPFPDASFDVVMSTFGVMFTPNQEKAASELARVCKPGGTIGLANWTPESFIGQVFKTIGKYIPPPPGVKSPALWGTKERLAELFGERARDIIATSREFTFRYRSPAHWIEVFRTYYGPMNKAFAALEGERQAAFTQRSGGADRQPQSFGRRHAGVAERISGSGDRAEIEALRPHSPSDISICAAPTCWRDLRWQPPSLQ